MKKTLTRLLALLLAIMSLTILLMTPVSAASTTSSYDCSGTSYGGVSKFFYVKTGTSSNSRKVTLTMTAGELWSDSEKMLAAKMPVYGAYEVKIFYWNAKSQKWVMEQDYDVYNKSSATIELDKKNTYYKIQIYSWRSSTIYNSYWKNNVKCTDKYKFQSHYSSTVNLLGSPIWGKIPTCTAKPKSGCTMYTSNPCA